MKKNLLLLSLFLIILCLPSPSHALVEVGAGLTITSFEDDLDSVDTDSGTALELSVGAGSVRFLLALQSSSHNQGDYEAWMVGPSFNLDTLGFKPRIYALLGSHEFENIDGWGLTLGGGVAWSVSQAASFGFDLRVSQWEGDGDVNVGTGTLQVLLRIGF